MCHSADATALILVLWQGGHGGDFQVVFAVPLAVAATVQVMQHTVIVVPSDSLNISEPARWVAACLLGRTRGHGRQDIIPSGRRINNNTFDVSDGDVPAASAGPP